MGTSAGNYGRAMYSNPDWRKRMSISHTLERVPIDKVCPKCGKVFQILRRKRRDGTFSISKRGERKYCSRSCANGRIHSEEWKTKVSEKLRYKNPNKCKNCGISLDGKNKRRKYCSKECYFEHESKDLNEYRKYCNKCKFRFNVYKFPNKFDLSLIEKYGWYKAKNHGDNFQGVTRDHIISTKFGYRNDVDPKIISHPANCKLIFHQENIKKSSKCGMTLDELIERIKNWGK